jgi:hypothetical protein
MNKNPKIDKYKTDNNLKTSEEIFGFDKPPEYQCFNINELIGTIKNTIKLANPNKYLNEEDANDRFYDIDYELKNFENDLEKLRKACEGLRNWGQEWKNMCKCIIENNDIEIEDLV